MSGRLREPQVERLFEPEKRGGQANERGSARTALEFPLRPKTPAAEVRRLYERLARMTEGV